MRVLVPRIESGPQGAMSVLRRKIKTSRGFQRRELGPREEMGVFDVCIRKAPQGQESAPSSASYNSKQKKRSVLQNTYVYKMDTRSTSLEEKVHATWLVERWTYIRVAQHPGMHRSSSSCIAGQGLPRGTWVKVTSQWTGLQENIYFSE